MKNGWTERIAELTESRDHWKREWRLLNAGLNMAEDKIKELEAENKRLIVQRDGAFARWKSAIAKYPKGADGCCCLFDADENQIQWCSPHAKLRDENQRLREALDLVISFIPDGWGMPLGFNQVAQQAREALKEDSHEG